MNVRRSSIPPRPQTTTPANLLLGSSTSGWYAAWKARKAEVPATPEPEPVTEGDAPDALARWLASHGEQ
jgi:hypothetical protein